MTTSRSTCDSFAAGLFPSRVAGERTGAVVTEALAMGALGAFGDRYGDIVKIYQMGEGDDRFSFEICGGPHVDHTGQLSEDGKRFKILKEEASSSGVRRIKAALL